VAFIGGGSLKVNALEQAFHFYFFGIDVAPRAFWEKGAGFGGVGLSLGYPRGEGEDGRSGNVMSMF
jgi:hypothetical protein